MMTTYRLALAGRATIDAHVTLAPGPHKIDAYGIAFNDDADVVAETGSTGYIDYCRACILYHELHRLIAGRWGIESQTIADAVETEFPYGCTCDE